jgi:hypothetical protein
MTRRRWCSGPPPSISCWRRRPATTSSSRLATLNRETSLALAGIFWLYWPEKWRAAIVQVGLRLLIRGPLAYAYSANPGAVFENNAAVNLW